MTLFPLLKDYLKQDRGIVVAVVVRGPADLLGRKALIPVDAEPEGALLQTAIGPTIVADARALLEKRASKTRQYELDVSGRPETVEVFFDVHAPSPKLIIVGAVHIASDLIHFAKPLKMTTYVIDPRTAFATDQRFAHADHLSHAWPDEVLTDIGLNNESHVVVVTHDPKLDDPALKIALPSPARYVGALGSPKTHAKRVVRLLEEGMAQEHVDRLHAPIGLNIGGRTPAEIALSIMAEIVAIRNNMPLANRAMPTP
ncbi:MAG: XdhC family protein [Anaerolineae bacterium]|nr:XdhC family protein [Anaerolineae bacterium]